MMIFTQCARDTEAQEQQKKKKRKRRPIVVALISFLLSLLLTAALAFAIPVTFLRFLLTDHNIEVIVDHVIDSIEIEKITFETPEGEKSVTEVILDFTSGIEGLNFITEEQINSVLLNDFAKQFIIDTLKQYGMSLKDGTDILGWTPEQIYGFIEANEENIVRLAREAGYEGEIPLEEKKEELIAMIGSAIGTEGISPEAILGDSEEGAQLRGFLDRAQLVFSDSTLYLAWGLVAFIAILILFLNIKYPGSFCRGCGFPAFIVGALYTLTSFAAKPLLAMITVENAILADIIDFTAGFAIALLADIAAPAAIIGLALIIVSFVIDVIRKIFSKA